MKTANTDRRLEEWRRCAAEPQRHQRPSSVVAFKQFAELSALQRPITAPRSRQITHLAASRIYIPAEQSKQRWIFITRTQRKRRRASGPRVASNLLDLITLLTVINLACDGPRNDLPHQFKVSVNHRRLLIWVYRLSLSCELFYPSLFYDWFISRFCPQCQRRSWKQ